jgi:hypothetical protein
MMSFGVPLGAKSPNHGDQETLGNPSSAKVGNQWHLIVNFSHK